jgi:Fanconi anemia group D2 protein
LIAFAHSRTEIINAFCAYDDSDVKSKILLRLNSILILENRLVDYMKICPFDPAAMCPSTTALPKSGLPSQIQDKKKTKPSSDSATVKTIRPFFRDLELITANVVCFSENLVSENAFKPEEILGVTPSILLYLMANFRRKVDSFFSLSNKVTSTSASGEMVDTNLPQLFESFKDIFPYLSLHLQTALLSVFDDVGSSQDSDTNASSVSIALETLGIFNKFVSFAANHPVSWSSNCRYLLSCLARNISWKALWPPSVPMDDIIEQCISTFAAFSPKFGLNCVVSAAIVETLNHVVSTQHNSQQSQRVSNVAMHLLGMEWNVPAKQKQDLLPCIVRHVVRHTADPIVPLRTFTDALLELSETTVRSSEIQAISHSTMSIFFQCCIEEQVGLMLRLSGRNDVDATIRGILNSITAFGDLCSLCKLWETNKRMHKVCLVFSTKYLDNVLKIMPLLSKCFASNRDEIVDILQKMQKGTRILQSLCSHCKATKDVTLIHAIPSLKKNLERVIFNVKSILEVHRCLKAFWVGNLKTKNLRGEEISSQVIPENGVIFTRYTDIFISALRRTD